VIFDWDGTAVPDRSADASGMRRLVEELCALGMELAVVSGTHLDNIDGQLAARPQGPGSLHLLLNRGSEVFRVGESGVELVERRMATPEEDAALDSAAELVVEQLAGRGLEARIVSQRLNRRKIDLIPVPARADPPKARIAELLAAVEERLHAAGVGSLKDVVELAEQAAVEAGLPAARVTSDVKHVEIGLTDKADSARWILADLWRRGVGAGLVLIAGDEMSSLGGMTGSDANLLIRDAARSTAVTVGVEPEQVPAGVVTLAGGPSAFEELLADQLARRRDGDVPEIDLDPGWTFEIQGIHPEFERANESLLALADGRIGTRGTPLGDHPCLAPLVIAAGVYRSADANTELRPGPLWNRLPASIDSERSVRRVLDLRTGVMSQELDTPDGSVSALLFSSLGRPGTAVLRCQGPTTMLAGNGPLMPPNPDAPVEVDDGVDNDHVWMWAGDREAGLGAAAAELIAFEGSAASLDRIAAYRAGTLPASTRSEAVEELDAARGEGFEGLFIRHRAAWASRWTDSDIEIDGDPEMQVAVRLALFHLMASAADSGAATVGARGLTGRKYGGHVFWDTEIFALPFFAATHPAAARAILEYRVQRLPAAMAAARAAGRAGARFPWESASAGDDVTPTSLRDGAGRMVEVHTGQMEEHIVADVAWATACYLEWTGDQAFLQQGGARLLVETARYWASRIETDADEHGHIRGVIGPDEYHVGVDDNAFTNVMARWNLRRAAGLDSVTARASDEEQLGWLTLADSLADGYDPDTGIYEQFAGFHALEPLVISEIADEPLVATDLLLDPDRVASAQVVKQPDVLMLHHLVPDEVRPGSLDPNLRFYEPRTANGSSLSPGVHAALYARAGQVDDALEALRLTTRIDLDDLSKNTAGGIHLAAMGSIWQAIAFGFAGLRAVDGVLRIDPSLPSQWRGLTFQICFRGARVRLQLDADEARVTTDRPVRFAVGAGQPTTISNGTAIPLGEGRQRPLG
jgi:trehalose/maltose hydrolase-like predicted phosphorylase